MTESSRRSDRSWHCRWYSGSLNWCLGSFSFLCRRSARRCSFSASRSACFFSHAAILHATRSQVSYSGSPSAERQTLPLVLSYSFSWLTSLRRRPLRSLHASRLVVFSIWAPRARSMEPNPGTHVESQTAGQQRHRLASLAFQHTSFSSREPGLQAIDGSMLQRDIEGRDSTVCYHKQVWRGRSLQENSTQMLTQGPTVLTLCQTSFITIDSIYYWVRSQLSASLYPGREEDIKKPNI